MSVDIHGHTDVRMAHYILQRLRIHACVRHVRAERVPEYMGCDNRERLIREKLSILVLEMLQRKRHRSGKPIRSRTDRMYKSQYITFCQESYYSEGRDCCTRRENAGCFRRLSAGVVRHPRTHRWKHDSKRSWGNVPDAWTEQRRLGRRHSNMLLPHPAGSRACTDGFWCHGMFGSKSFTKYFGYYIISMILGNVPVFVPVFWNLCMKRGLKMGKRKTPGAIETTSLGAMELIARFELATSSLPRE